MDTQRDCSSIMNSFLHNMLDYSEIKANRFQKRVKLFNLKDCLHKVYKLFKYKADIKKLDLQLLVDDDNLIIKTDPERLSQVVMCLLGNAIKHTNNGFIRIHAQVSDNVLSIYV